MPSDASVAGGGYAIDRRALERRDDVLVYTGEVLNTAMEVIGQVGVDLYAASDARDTDFTASILDVYPDGRAVVLGARVVGIIRAFHELGQAGSASLRAVGPGISDALLATAVGLFAAIPAAVAYNYFGHMLKEVGARMDDFSIEFLNMAERSFEE